VLKGLYGLHYFEEQELFVQKNRKKLLAIFNGNEKLLEKGSFKR
jgi:hypothetical protein